MNLGFRSLWSWTCVLNPVDVLIFVALLISLGVAFLRGLVQEAMSLATWIAAVAAGYLLAEPMQPYLTGLVTHQLRPGACSPAASFSCWS